LFLLLLSGIIIVLPLHAVLRLGGDLRNYLVPLGIAGALLVITAVLAKTGRWLKFFFILTGASAVGEPVSLFLHGQLVKVWSTEPVTYVLVFFILPVTFVTGAGGTIVAGILRLITGLRNARNGAPPRGGK
jgi:hypothetical protein